MENQFERTELLLGKDAIQKLKNAHVAVFGVGGVGGFVVEALVRSGVGEIRRYRQRHRFAFKHKPTDNRTSQYCRTT